MAKILQSGSLDRPIQLFHRDSLPLPKRDEAGQIITLADEPYATPNAKREEKTGEEKELKNHNTALATVTYTIRYRTDVRLTDLLVEAGTKYDILRVAEGPGRRQWTIITAQRIDS